MRIAYNPLNFNFFKHPERCGEIIDLKSNIESLFNKIYKSERYNEKIFNFSTINDHPMLSKVIDYSLSNHNIIEIVKSLDQNSNCEKIFAYYLFKISKFTNSEFFDKVATFVILFREFINKSNIKCDKTFTEYYNCEDVPDMTNEFITQYLCNDYNLFHFNKEESIDLTINFCQWLYDNNFTSSKLSLINQH